MIAPPPHWRCRLPVLFASFVWLLACAVYAPGLRGEFVFDDVTNLFDNAMLQRLAEPGWAGLWQAAGSGHAGPLGRPVAMLSFALNAMSTGMAPFYFKLGNLLIHLLNGVLVYVLSRRLLAVGFKRDDVQWPALWVAAVWLLHPLNLTGVLYVVQRMTSLSALFSLLGLLAYVQGRLWLGLEALGPSPRRGVAAIAAAFVLCLPLSALSKENGVLLPLFIGLCEWLILRFQAPDRRIRQGLFVLVGATAVLPTAFALLWLGWHWDWVLRGYAHRTFTFAERVLTEPRVLWLYVRLLLAPDWRLMGLHHDDLAVSRNMFLPIDTLPALLQWLLLGGLALAVRRRWPWFGFGVLFFLAGHAMESTVIALELVHEHRNYLPGFGLLLGVAGTLWQWQAGGGARYRPVLLAGAGIFLAACAWQTALRAASWQNNLALAMTEARHHPRSPRSLGFAGYQLLRLGHAYAGRGDAARANEEIDQARIFFRAVNRIDDAELGGHFGLLTADAMQGKGPDPAVMRELAASLRKDRLSSGSVNQLVLLSRSRAAGLDANLADQQALSVLFAAMLENPHLQGGQRQAVAGAAAEHARLAGDGELLRKAAAAP